MNKISITNINDNRLAELKYPALPTQPLFFKFCDACGQPLSFVSAVLTIKDTYSSYDGTRDGDVDIIYSCINKHTSNPSYYTSNHKWTTHSSGGGCFIATAAYGTPLDPQIDILRAWRDTTLKNCAAGRLFIKVYYKISPPIADFIRPRNYLRKAFRVVIELIIKRIKA